MTNRSARLHAFLALLLCSSFVGTGVLSGCQADTGEQSSGGTKVTVSGAPSPTVSLSEEDSAAAYSADDCTKITFQDSSAAVDGEGAAWKDGVLTITKAGSYLLSGTLGEGKISVDAGKEDTVRLIFSGVSITSSGACALQTVKCEKTILQLDEDTANQITVTGSAEEELSAAVFATDDLTITGQGSLTLKTSAQNGIQSKDTLRITGGTLSVESADHGLVGKENIYIAGGDLSITSGGDGLHCSYDKDDEDKGQIYIENGTLTIQAQQDGIQSKKDVTVAGGTLQITSGGGAEKAAGSASGEDESTAKGLKAGAALTVSAGTVTIDAKDDALHADGAVTIGEPTLTIRSGDDGIHSDSDVLIQGGSVTIEQSKEGIEGHTVTISGGEVDVTSSDDGINCSGKTDSTTSDTSGGFDGSMPEGMTPPGGFDGSMPESMTPPGGFDGSMPEGMTPPGGFDGSMPEGMTPPEGFDGSMPEGMTSPDASAAEGSASEGGRSGFGRRSMGSGKTDIGGRGGFGGFSGMEVDETAVLTISGGTVCVNAQGDALDSNGRLLLSGGTVILNGTTRGGNGIMDHGSDMVVSGGVLIGAGSSDMLELPDSGSTQKTAVFVFSSEQKAGTLVTVSDSKGQVLAAMAPEKTFRCLVFSSSQLKEGETCHLSTGGTATGSSLHGYYTSAAVDGGTEAGTVTISSDPYTKVTVS